MKTSLDFGYTSYFRVWEVVMRTASEGRFKEARQILSSLDLPYADARPYSNESTARRDLQKAIEIMSTGLSRMHEALIDFKFPEVEDADDAEGSNE